MGTLRKLPPRKPRKIGETVFTATGSRLTPVRKVAASDWFLPLIVTLPVAAFVLVILW